MTSWRVTRGVWAMGIVAAALGSAGPGCSSPEAPRPLTADAFVSRRVEGRANPEPIDQPGLVIPDGVKPQVYEGSDAPEVSEVSETVRDVVRESTDVGDGGAGGRPGAKPRAAGRDGEARTGNASSTRASDEGNGSIGDPSGQYLVFGTVLSKVNNQPIYAHKVLTILNSALRAEAQQNDPAGFRQAAAYLIARQVDALEQEELVFAAAQKVLAERERALADILTARERNKEITRAGGSLELAKRRLADRGWNYDEWIDYEYRRAMTMVYIEKRVKPLVQVSAADIRRFYDANRATLFAREERARFRVIKIDPRNRELELNGPDDAERLAREIRAEAVSGKVDFEALARRTNEPSLKDTGGLVGTDDGWLPRGSYVSEKVEAAVWGLRPGQVTEVVQDREAFYVAKLEERQDATEKPFEDVAVQEQIHNTLYSQQLKELLDREYVRLKHDAVIQRQPRMLQTAVDMAMQRYPAWAAAK